MHIQFLISPSVGASLLVWAFLGLASEHYSDPKGSTNVASFLS